MSERLIGILADSFFKILIPGLTVTIPLTVLSFSIATVLYLGDPGYTSSGAALCDLLRHAQPWDRPSGLPGCGHRIFHQ